MKAYLDTNVILWLAEGDVARISPKAQEVIRRANLLLSPIVLLELQYLLEVGRLALSPTDIVSKLTGLIGLQVCDLAFPKITEAAMNEHWTRDPFDRLIVAHAKANAYAVLVTADRKIRDNYPEALW